MSIFAISVDSPADSRSFAHDEGITFPLLSDADGAVARAYTGFNVDDTAIPGVVVIRPDGTIGYRQIATSKDDRLTAPELLAVLDRTFGTSGPAGTRVTPLERTQLRLDAGGGGDRSGVGVASLALLVPLDAHLIVGPWIATDSRGSSHLDLDGALFLRAPILHDSGALQLGAVFGDTTNASWNAAARAGLWFALGPHLGLELDAAYDIRPGAHDAVFTLGVSRLFGR